MTAQTLAGKKVLVVDDEADLRELLCELLQSRGCTTQEAANGREAFARVLAEPFDAVLSDIRMPGGNGVELLDRLRQRDPRVPPIFLITGFSDLSEEDAIRKGASAVFPKPFDRDELLDTMERVLKS